MTGVEARALKPAVLISAPSSLGLRPTENGAEPGTWRAPDALLAAGLRESLSAALRTSIERQGYDFFAQPGTLIRNGLSIRRFSLELGEAVHSALQDGCFPIVIGGDCSVLLGCLYAARRGGGKGLVHVDGHSDFFHPGNYDTRSRLGAAAGMDLALATGRGELLLTHWPDRQGPLVSDDDVIQIGERERVDLSHGDTRTTIMRLAVQEVIAMGPEGAAEVALARLAARNLNRAWLHVDLDVLDEAVMPAVDSPGAPGLNFAQLSSLLRTLLRSGRFAGADVAIYDPERDPEHAYADAIVAALGAAFETRL